MMIETVSAEAFALAPDFRVSASSADSQGAIVFAPLSGGGFVASWHEYTSTTRTIWAQRFDSNAHKVGAPIAVGYEGTSPVLASAPNGGFFVAWVSESAYPATF